MSSKKVDLLDIRLSPFGWKNDLPGCPARSLISSDNPLNIARDVSRYGHQVVAIPGCNDAKDQIVVSGGLLAVQIEGVVGRTSDFLKSCQCLEVGKQNNPSWNESSIPDMNVSRAYYGSVYVDNRKKLYAFGGDRFNREKTFEVLDFDDLSTGWKLHRMPSALANKTICKAVAIDNQFIYAWLCRPQNDGILGEHSFCSYNTQTCKWNLNLAPPPCKPRHMGFHMTSICIPGEGTYVVVVGAPSVQAYHIESKRWQKLPDLPDEAGYGSAVSSLGNRYVVVAGGDVERNSTDRVVGFDWDTKDWFNLPSLPTSLHSTTGTIVAGKKWVITDNLGRNTLSLDISYGIGWAKEKQLLLCFRGNARGNENDPPCPLEGLDTGVFANILSYLFVPFSYEIECEGSIFAEMKVQTSSGASGEGKRGGSTLLQSQSKKIRG